VSFVAQCSVRVPVSPEVAFDRLADYGSWPQWMPRSFRPVGAAEGALAIGRRLRVKIAGVPAAANIEVSEVRRPAEIAWRGGIPGVVWADHRFLFEPDGQGATRVTSLETWSGGLAKLLRLVLQPVAERVGGQQLAALGRAVGSR
jgi:hypothetical protein